MKDSSLGLRILVVDDDENCLESLESFLISDGHDICTAKRGQEAIDVARRFRLERRQLDLTILDYRMPDFSGVETYQRLVVEIPRMQAIFVTGDPSSAIEQQVESVGGLVLMHKPVRLVRMRSVLAEFENGTFEGRG